MAVFAEIAVAFLIVLGAAFALIGSWGLARLPTMMTRLHGPTKASTLGVGACLMASMIYFPMQGGVWSANELLIALFLFITTPISANMIAKAHLHRQRSGIDAEAMDDIRGGLPKPDSEADWATFSGGIPEKD